MALEQATAQNIQHFATQTKAGLTTSCGAPAAPRRHGYARRRPSPHRGHRPRRVVLRDVEELLELHDAAVPDREDHYEIGVEAASGRPDLSSPRLTVSCGSAGTRVARLAGGAHHPGAGHRD